MRWGGRKNGDNRTYIFQPADKMRCVFESDFLAMLSSSPCADHSKTACDIDESVKVRIRDRAKRVRPGNRSRACSAHLCARVIADVSDDSAAVVTSTAFFSVDATAAVWAVFFRPICARLRLAMRRILLYCRYGSGESVDCLWCGGVDVRD